MRRQTYGHNLGDQEVTHLTKPSRFLRYVSAAYEFVVCRTSYRVRIKKLIL